MKSKEFYSAINDIDDDLIEKAMVISTPKNKVIPFAKILSLAACFCFIVVGAYFYNNQSTHLPFDLTDRIVVEQDAIVADVIVNIEGIITDVSDDGMSFRIDHEKWVTVTNDTEIGTIATSEDNKAKMLFEPTFRVGNLVTGFTEDEHADEIIAYAIYTNWNWNDPIR
ncbi:hypothetical protein JJQ72_14875 [Paenibacillus sp. F411]|uniref:hypothetical protein n=1 Tax=Paenibacillus sp. F411 TaxID=2820239 RepID=UPI001AAEF539|nr:hypothetical protein [Paenibacillus sp. F411]MBO2945260.1 hypothetical protein [Paenibacillus sp. F411]